LSGSGPPGPTEDAETGYPAVEAVVFDLGSVCIDWDPRYLYRTMFDGDDAAMEHFLAEIATQDWNAQMDAGVPWADAIEALSGEYPEWRRHIEAFRGRWEEMLGEAIHGTVEIVERLAAAGVPVFALSNWSADTFPIAEPRYPFLRRFDGIVISGREGVRKPDPRIFRLLLDRYALRARATVFIDDVEENVVVARALGLIALRFTDADTLRHDLIRLGLPAG
jgi:HAD superfamily hydrolase (TIGR01509 family)